MRPGGAAARVEHEYGRVKDHDFALTGRELRERSVVSAGLTQESALERRHLIRADDERIGRADAARFRGRKPLGHALRRFPRRSTFIGVGFADLERQAEPLEQLASIPRRRGQQQLPSRGRRYVTHGFDSRNSVTYDARPMSGSLQAWYSLRDLEALGARQGELSGELAIERLPRLAGLLNSSTGSVRARLRFRQRGVGPLELTLEYDTTVELVCQRCLEPFAQPIAERVDMAVVEQGGAEASVPQGYEPIELDDGRLSPALLIEDELIVSIPLVPKHARVEDCGSLAHDLMT